MGQSLEVTLLLRIRAARALVVQMLPQRGISVVSEEHSLNHH